MNTPFVKIYMEDGTYVADSNDIAINSLGNFLRDMNWKASILGVIKDLYNDQFPGLSTNMTFVDVDGDYVEIRDAYYDEELYTEETNPYLRIRRNEFARILRAWLEFITNRGQEFLITLENGKISITTKIDTQRLIPHTLIAKEPNMNPFAKIYMRDNAYQSESNDIPLNNLANFLSRMNNEEAVFRCVEFAYTNESYALLSKNTIAYRDGHYINIRARCYDTTLYSEETIPYLHIHRDEFKHILNIWFKFVQSNGKEFLITLENGKIQINTSK